MRCPVKSPDYLFCRRLAGLLPNARGVSIRSREVSVAPSSDGDPGSGPVGNVDEPPAQARCEKGSHRSSTAARRPNPNRVWHRDITATSIDTQRTRANAGEQLPTQEETHAQELKQGDGCSVRTAPPPAAGRWPLAEVTELSFRPLGTSRSHGDMGLGLGGFRDRQRRPWPWFPSPGAGPPAKATAQRRELDASEQSGPVTWDFLVGAAGFEPTTSCV
jgi:hypothetical protein